MVAEGGDAWKLCNRRDDEDGDDKDAAEFDAGSWLFEGRMLIDAPWLLNRNCWFPRSNVKFCRNSGMGWL